MSRFWQELAREDDESPEGLRRPQVSPGKVTLTSRLAPSSAPSSLSSRPARSGSAATHSTASQPASDYQTRDWMSSALLGRPEQREQPVQARGNIAAEDPDKVHRAAATGIESGGQPLPHLETVQKAFGPRHDLSAIKAHVGGTATESCEQMGAEAYASGEHVAFKSTPDLHTAAHEATHVVQQRAGVQLRSAIGAAGDSYEREADAVADMVVAGQSDVGRALPSLGGARGESAGSLAPASAIQRQEATDNGAGEESEDKEQKKEKKPKTEEIFVVGGQESQSTSWGNFIWAVDLRLKVIEEVEPDTKLSVMIFKEAYEKRATAEGKDEKDFYNGPSSELQEIIDKHEERLDTVIELIEVDSGEEFFNYMNTGDISGESDKRKDSKISNWEYFGHGLDDQLGVELNYDETDPTAEGITEEDIAKFDPNAFSADPRFMSWGCNTASGDWLEEYRKRVGGTAIGANALTNYHDVKHGRLDSLLEHKRLPYPDEGGKWITLQPSHMVTSIDNTHLVEDPSKYPNTERYEASILAKLASNTTVDVFNKGEGETFNKYESEYHWWQVRVLSGDHEGLVGWVMKEQLKEPSEEASGETSEE